MSSSANNAERTEDVVETIASLARTFTAMEIDALVDESGTSCLLEIRQEERRKQQRYDSDEQGQGKILLTGQ